MRTSTLIGLCALALPAVAASCSEQRDPAYPQDTQAQGLTPAAGPVEDHHHSAHPAMDEQTGSPGAATNTEGTALSGMNAAPFGGSPTPEPAAPALTEPQILALVETANTGEIEHAKLAQARAKHPDVKNFAKMMIQHHGEAKTKQTQLEKKIAVAQEPTDQSAKMFEDAKKAGEELKALQGPDFDKAYMQKQVEDHKKVLSMLDNEFIPNAKNPELKKMLEEVRARVDQHLQEAQAITAKLNP